MSDGPRQPAAGSDALILRLQDYREADRLVWLLTAERGRVSALARGARRSHKRFGGHLDLFQRVHARLTHGRGSLHSLSECRVVAAWPRLRADVPRYAAACVVAELAIALSREEAEDAPLFASVTETLALLDEPVTAVTAGLAAALILRLLTTAGFVMDLSVCSGCERPLGDATVAGAAAGATLEAGGRLWCGGCDPVAAAGPPHALRDERTGSGAGRRLSGADVAALGGWQRLGLSDAARLPAGPEAVGAVRDLLREVLGRPLKSEAFLWEIIR